MHIKKQQHRKQSKYLLIHNTYITIHPNLPGGSDGKGSACNAGDLGSVPGLRRSPGEGNCLPTPIFLPGESHGQRTLVGYSPWGHKESDKTERQSQHVH